MKRRDADVVTTPACDPGRVKTPTGGTQRGIVFPGPIEFERSWEHSSRRSRSGGRSYYVLCALRRFYTAKTQSGDRGQIPQCIDLLPASCADMGGGRQRPRLDSEQEIAPNVAHISMIYNPDNPTPYARAFESAAGPLDRGIQRKRSCGESMRRCTDRSRQARAAPRPRPHFGRSKAN